MPPRAELEAALKQEPLLEDVTSDLEVTSPQINVQIDRDKAAAMGVTANAIESAFYDAYGTKWVSTIYGSVNEYKVLLELDPRYQADPAALSLLYFKATPTTSAAGAATVDPAVAAARASSPGGSGTVVPLDTLAKATQVVGPQAMNHYGQLPSVTVSFGLAPGAALGYGADPGPRRRREHPARDGRAASSRGRPPRFRIRSATSPSCWSSRSWSSTSSSGFSTRVTSTR